MCRSDPNQGPASGFSAKTRAQRTSSGMNRHSFYTHTYPKRKTTKKWHKHQKSLPAAMEHRLLSKSVLLHLTVVCVSLCLLMQLKSGEQVTHSSCHPFQPKPPPIPPSLPLVIHSMSGSKTQLIWRDSSVFLFVSVEFPLSIVQVYISLCNGSKDQTRIRTAE